MDFSLSYFQTFSANKLHAQTTRFITRPSRIGAMKRNSYLATIIFPLRDCQNCVIAFYLVSLSLSDRNRTVSRSIDRASDFLTRKRVKSRDSSHVTLGAGVGGGGEQIACDRGWRAKRAGAAREKNWDFPSSNGDVRRGFDAHTGTNPARSADAINRVCLRAIVAPPWRKKNSERSQRHSRTVARPREAPTKVASPGAFRAVTRRLHAGARARRLVASRRRTPATRHRRCTLGARGKTEGERIATALRSFIPT